jgi:peptide/nickel transport system permease protein
MTAYIIRRLLVLPFLLLGVSILIFLMMSLLTPYERVSLYVPDFPKRAGALDDLIEKYGLNDPIFFNTGKMWQEKNPLALFESQYFRWMGKILRGDLGFSKVGKRPVTEALLLFPYHSGAGFVVHCAPDWSGHLAGDPVGHPSQHAH